MNSTVAGRASRAATQDDWEMGDNRRRADSKTNPWLTKSARSATSVFRDRLEVGVPNASPEKSTGGMCCGEPRSRREEYRRPARRGRRRRVRRRRRTQLAQTQRHEAVADRGRRPSRHLLLELWRLSERLRIHVRQELRTHAHSICNNRCVDVASNADIFGVARTGRVALCVALAPNP